MTARGEHLPTPAGSDVGHGAADFHDPVFELRAAERVVIPGRVVHVARSELAESHRTTRRWEVVWRRGSTDGLTWLFYATGWIGLAACVRVGSGPGVAFFAFVLGAVSVLLAFITDHFQMEDPDG